MAIPFGFWKGDVAGQPGDSDQGAATATAFNLGTYMTLQRARQPVGDPEVMLASAVAC